MDENRAIIGRYVVSVISPDRKLCLLLLVNIFVLTWCLHDADCHCRTHVPCILVPHAYRCVTNPETYAMLIVSC